MPSFAALFVFFMVVFAFPILLSLTRDLSIVVQGAEALHLVFIAAAMIKIGSIVIHCYAFERMVAFWQGALHYVPRAPASGGWVVLSGPEGRGPNISFQARDRRDWRRSWLHLDLYTDRQEEEVRRLLTIGARRHAWRYPPNPDYVVLEDPDGNLFCVVQKPHAKREEQKS